MRLSEEPLIGSDRIRERVEELAQDICRDFDGRDLVLVAVLKGAAVFAADLMRHLPGCACLEFVRARSYSGTESQGRVAVNLLPESPLRGRHVLLVEDILDTGRTTHAVLERLRQEGPAQLRLCALLDKPSRRIIPVQADYVGFTIDNHFVVGYGLDHDERYRQLPAVYTLEPDA